MGQKVEIEITPDNKCSFCTGSICCTYVTHSIDTPRSKDDFRHLLWQVSHDHVEVYQDEDGWFLLIRGHCEHLRPGGACGIYEVRPQVCRDYDNEWCEFDSPAEEHFELYFTNYAELLAYCRKRFRTWDKQFAR